MSYIDITPEQYHAGLDKLWSALGDRGNGIDDVFTLCAERITELEKALNEAADLAYDNINNEDYESVNNVLVTLCDKYRDIAKEDK